MPAAAHGPRPTIFSQLNFASFVCCESLDMTSYFGVLGRCRRLSGQQKKQANQKTPKQDTNQKKKTTTKKNCC